MVGLGCGEVRRGVIDEYGRSRVSDVGKWGLEVCEKVGWGSDRLVGIERISPDLHNGNWHRS